MAYSVLVLDDHTRSADATKRVILYLDPRADVIIVETVPRAKAELESRTAPLAFVVVDLLLEQQELQGIDFITHVLRSQTLTHLPIFVLSQHIELLQEVAKLRSQRITFKRRSDDYDVIQAALSRFVTDAQRRYP